MKRLMICCCAAVLAAAGAFAAEEGVIDPRGFLYGTVETESGNSYTGFLRWGGEEAFWDDHFNAGKSELPFADARPRGERERRRIRIFGVTISYGTDDAIDRQFVARFGDIREIEPRRWGETRVTMRDGTVYEIGDTSNDVGATVTVDDATLGEVDVRWDRIESVRFSPAPADAVPAARRLAGVLTTETTTFEGYIQWDLDECLTTDKLDGETEDGDVSIEMGRIAAIEKRNNDGAWVELLDGRRMLLEDTNDVDSSTNGIFVEDARFGRVKVGWEEFERVEFKRSATSGRGYDEYGASRPLAGRVVDTDGESFPGRIVFDLDEEFGWELLHGSLDDVEYTIPFSMIRSIEPLSRSRSRVILATGTELTLEDGQDVSSRNDGLVILAGDGDSETYLAWRSVERIELD